MGYILNMNRIGITTYLSEEEHEKLKELAMKNDRSLSSQIRLIIKEKIKEVK